MERSKVGISLNCGVMMSFIIRIQWHGIDDSSKIVLLHLRLLEIPTAFRAIMGGTHPYHMISTIDLDSPTIKNILDHREIFDEVIDKASQVKAVFMVFQKPPPGVSPIVIISARPQSNNACSSFTVDLMNAADFVTRQIQSTSFVNFAVDGVSLETKDVMTTKCNFLCGWCNFTSAADNKHNVKNDQHQLIGGASICP